MADSHESRYSDREAARARLAARQAARQASNSTSKSASTRASNQASNSASTRTSNSASSPATRSVSREASSSTSSQVSSQTSSPASNRTSNPPSRQTPSPASRTTSVSQRKDSTTSARNQAKSGGATLVETALGIADKAGSALRRALEWMLQHPKAVITCIVGLLVIICVVTVARSCATRDSLETAEQNRTAYEQQSEYVEGEINLPASLDPQVEEQLKTMALENDDVDWIVRHTEEIGVDGEKVLKKLLKLVAKEEQAISFVRNLPEKYPQEAGEPFTDAVVKGTVPHLYQWDERWGYTVYSGTLFGVTGCCPTCMSMVYMGLTGSNDKTPYDMGKLADDMGYMEDYAGTDARFLTEGAPKLGMSCQEMMASADVLESVLQEGCVVICNMDVGDFTETGHYIVATGCDKSGNVTVNDPYSVVNSEKTWDANLIADQAISFYVFSAS